MDNIRNTMSFEEFQYKVIQQINERGIETDVYHSHKVNREVTVVTTKNNDAIKPTVYIEDMYLNYMYGTALVDIVDRAVDRLTLKDKVSFEVPVFNSPDAKDRLYCSAINRNMNTELLKDIPHQDMEDLALVVRYRVDTNASCLVNDSICSSMQLTHDEVLNIAKENTFNSGYYFNSLYNTINYFLRDNEDELDDFMSDTSIPPDEEVYILTTKEKSHGASLIFSKQILSEVHNKINDDFYIIPSSIHETLIMPGKSVDKESFPSLKDMVKDVNQYAVDISEKLSDNIYYYNAKTNTFSIADGNERNNTVTEKITKNNIKGR